MSELKFSSEQEAMQYLSDLTGKQVKIAAKRDCPVCVENGEEKAGVGPNGYCFRCKKTTAENIMKKASADADYDYDMIKQMHNDYKDAAREADSKLWDARSQYADVIEEIEVFKKVDPEKAKILEGMMNRHDFVKTLKAVFKDNLL